MHQDHQRDLAREFHNELLTGGVDEATLCRMIGRAIHHATEIAGSDISIQESWLAVGGNPDIAPDKDAVVAALKSISEAAGSHRPVAGASGSPVAAPSVPDEVIAAISAYGDARADNAPDSAAKIGTAITLIRDSYSQLLSPANLNPGKSEKERVTLPTIGTTLGDGREVWVAIDGDRTRLRFINNARKMDLAISKEATLALLVLLMERVYPQCVEKGFVKLPRDAKNFARFKCDVLALLSTTENPAIDHDDLWVAPGTVLPEMTASEASRPDVENVAPEAAASAGLADPQPHNEAN